MQLCISLRTLMDFISDRYSYTTLRNATKYETVPTPLIDSSNILSIRNYMKYVFKGIQNIPRTIFSPCFPVTLSLNFSHFLCLWVAFVNVVLYFRNLYTVSFTPLHRNISAN
jgi:hypothetical protein